MIGTVQIRRMTAGNLPGAAAMRSRAENFHVKDVTHGLAGMLWRAAGKGLVVMRPLEGNGVHMKGGASAHRLARAEKFAGMLWRVIVHGLPRGVMIRIKSLLAGSLRARNRSGVRLQAASLQGQSHLEINLSEKNLSERNPLGVRPRGRDHFPVRPIKIL